MILITDHAEVQLAVEAMRRGAYDFIERPFVAQSLIAVLRRAMDHRALVLDNRRLRVAAGQRDDVEARLPGRSAVMIELRYPLRAIGASEADALIVGPTGAGKEVVAHAMHDLSPRNAKPFVAVNCAALPAELIEAELFGHEAGAVPGVMRARFGRFEHARGGTVLLDEVGQMPLDVQAKLLRVLQERVIRRLGSNDAIPLDVRFIATSKTDLAVEVAKEAFREDLYWRLNVAMLRVPPLSARREDISLLFLQLVRAAAARHSAPDRTPEPEMLADLAGRDWPGNVRELRNMADRFVLGLDWMPGSSGPEVPRLVDRVAGFGRSVIAGAIAAQSASLYRNLAYNSTEAFEYVGLVTEVPITLVARKDFEPIDMASFITYVKANAETITMANAGIGAASHLCGMLFMQAMEAPIVTVPYKGTGPAMTELQGGQVDIMCDQSTNTTEQIKGGTIKAFAVTTPARLEIFPDLPTVAEAGLPAMEVSIWHGIYTPKGTPAEVNDRLSATLQKALADPEIVAKFAELGTAPSPAADAIPAALKAKLEGEIARWKPVIDAAGVYAD